MLFAHFQGSKNSIKNMEIALFTSECAKMDSQVEGLTPILTLTHTIFNPRPRICPGPTQVYSAGYFSVAEHRLFPYFSIRRHGSFQNRIQRGCHVTGIFQLLLLPQQQQRVDDSASMLPVNGYSDEVADDVEEVRNRIGF